VASRYKLGDPDDPDRPVDEAAHAAVVEAIAGALAPAELTAVDRESLHARIMARIEREAPADTFTIRAQEMHWVTVGPGVEVKVLRVDRERNDQTVLIRMQPGAVVVGHRHTQEEECLILEGEVFIGGYRLSQGDMHVARPGARHGPIRAPGGALLMIRSEMPPTNFRIA
jgi:quercetin dioxygenase-like cupin family protein